MLPVLRTVWLLLTPLLMIVVAAELVIFLWLSRSPLPELTGVPSGVLLDGNLFDASGSRCHLIRITNDSCPYCKDDYDIFRRLAERARHQSCSVVAVSPQAGRMALVPNAPYEQLRYVSLAFGRTIDSSFTPQTMIADQSGAIVFLASGAMTATDEADGIRALLSFGSHASVGK